MLFDALIRRIERRETSPKKEVRMVNYPTFSEGDQDPVEWLKAFNRACASNQVKRERMVTVAASYLKGSALT